MTANAERKGWKRENPKYKSLLLVKIITGSWQKDQF